MLFWDPGKTPEKINSALEILSEEYPLCADSSRCNLRFETAADAGMLNVSHRDGCWYVKYSREDIAVRGAAYALAGRECRETHSFKTHGILFDCTRGNVVTVSHFKYWLRKLALFGYNTAMIYTKDAYELPDEPYFGYMRGAYTLDELREIDAYAAKLNIEMIASIQALGHLEPILRWKAYGKVRDTASVIMVDEPESYKLLEKMLKFWSDALSSRRIHLGMDETFDLGRGRFMNINGYENPFDIYNRHLNKVCLICKKFDLHPMIWQDMYFRYANQGQDYYDTSAEVCERVKKAIPPEVTLTHWDYYHVDADMYVTMLKKTEALNNKKPVMASGVWTWNRFWCDYEMTYGAVKACIDGCRKSGVDQLIYTMWGDDGGFCEFDSAFAALAWAADCGANEVVDETRAARIFETVFGTSYEVQKIAGDLCFTGTDNDGERMKVIPTVLLWDDPLLGIAWRDLPAMKKDIIVLLSEKFRDIREKLAPHYEDDAAGMICYAWHIADVLIRKFEFRNALEKAYSERDREALKDIAERAVPEMISALDELHSAFRKQWMRSFKVFGMELMQIRLGGLVSRYRETAAEIEELLNGKRENIPALEVSHQPGSGFPGTYCAAATGGFFI